MIQTLNPKLFKSPSQTTTYTVNFTSTLGSLTIASLTSVIASPSGLTISAPTVNGPITVGGETIAANMSINFTAAGGTANTEYSVAVIIVASDSSVIQVNVVVLVTDLDLQYYGSVTDATNYFLFNPLWAAASISQQMGSLIQASRSIDRLNFIGDKVDPLQEQQFPRTLTTICYGSPTYNFGGVQTVSPIPMGDIISACYEEGIALINDPDVNQQILDLRLTSEGISSARSTYNTAYVPASLINGITSVLAWNLLQPYIQDCREINLVRVN